MPLADTTHDQPTGLLSRRDFAQLAQLLWLFHAPLNAPRLAPTDLEHELTAQHSDYTTSLIKRALREITGSRGIEDSKLERHIERAWAIHGHDHYTIPPDLGQSTIMGISSDARTRLVLELCELAVARSDRIHASARDSRCATEWRTRPVGADALGRRYWLFCDSYLFRDTHKQLADLLLRVLDDPAVRRSVRAQAVRKCNVTLRDVENADRPRHGFREPDGSLWELVSSTAEEWGRVPGMFETATAQPERALHRKLSELAAEIVPILHAETKRRRVEEAVVHRKRSTRLAMKELAVKKERAAKELAMKEHRTAQSRVLAADCAGDVRRDEPRHESIAEVRDIRARRRELVRIEAIARSTRNSAARRCARAGSAVGGEDDDDDWMFDCLCGKAGHNYDDGRTMTACERCEIWQHLGCALRNEAARLGRQMDEEDWETVHYICPKCRSKSTSSDSKPHLETTGLSPTSL